MIRENKTKKRFVRNMAGLRIVTCCASCTNFKYKGLIRICDLHKVEVEGGDLCDDWKMSIRARNEGKLNNKTTI